MNYKEYDDIQALRFSDAKRLLHSGLHYAKGAPDKEDPDKHVLGTLVHAMVLEGKDLRTTYAIKPKGMSFTTKEGKAWRRAQSLPVLAGEAAERVPRMADALARNKLACSFIERCALREQVIVGMLGGIKCKARIDMVGIDAERHPGFAEIKTSLDVRADFLARRICNEPFHYDLQMEWYAALLRAESILENDGPRPWSVWLAVENHLPFDVAVYVPSDAMIASGTDKLHDVLTTFAACTKSGQWLGTGGDALRVIDPPAYRLRELQYESSPY
jgi:hypothetical protein